MEEDSEKSGKDLLCLIKILVYSVIKIKLDQYHTSVIPLLYYYYFVRIILQC